MCVLLYYFREMSVADIAQTMECSEGTIKSRLSAARDKIRAGVLLLERAEGVKLYALPLLPLLLGDSAMTCTPELMHRLLQVARVRMHIAGKDRDAEFYIVPPGSLPGFEYEKGDFTISVGDTITVLDWFLKTPKNVTIMHGGLVKAGGNHSLQQSFDLDKPTVVDQAAPGEYTMQYTFFTSDDITYKGKSNVTILPD